MVIYKYEVSVHGEPTHIPKGGEILAAGVQGNDIVVWARVNPETPTVPHYFPVYGTGHEIDELHSCLPLINTVFLGPLVFHVFDGGECH